MKFPTLISISSSSGKSLQPRGRCRLTRGRVDFSPLFIGEITSTTASCCVFSNSCVFQSPLHRGNHFNLFIVLKGHPPGLISVPSSSGKSLQRNLAQSDSPNRQISVPSSSGKSLQLGKDGELETVRFNFSPLFIGEITSTSMSLKDGKRLDAISVPSSSGKSLQPHDCDSYFVLYSISVPSSSGKSLQQWASSRRINTITNFSPLFIGEITSTLYRGSGINAANHFSPLFIGEITSTTEPTGGINTSNGISVPSSSGKSLQHWISEPT